MDVFPWARRTGRAYLSLLLLLIACGSPKKPELDAASADIRVKYADAVKRLTTSFLENNWVVSRELDGSPAHMGEGLLWSGIALSALPCAEAESIATTLQAMVVLHEGALIRIDPLGEYAGGREITLDGALGLYRGIADQMDRCGQADAWKLAVKKHLAFLEANDNRMHPNAKAELVEHFDYLPALIGYKLGLRGEPSSDRLRLLEQEVAAWAAAVNAGHKAAYRVHLGLIALETVETLGVKVEWGSFCLATKGVNIPTVEHRCGRDGLKDWIDAFQYNEWEYRFQRSGSWEKPDGKGLLTPGLDLLVAIRDAYEIKP